MSFLLPFLPMLLAGAAGAGSKLTEKKPSMEKFDVLDPQQKAFQQQILQLFSGQGGGQMSGPLAELQKMISGDPESMKAFEDPIKRQFNEQIVPGLAERFSGAGAGAQRSSAFQQALGGAGADLSERLASLKGQMKIQGLQGLIPFLQQAFQPSFGLMQKQGGGFLSNLLGGFAGGIAPGAGMAASQGFAGLGGGNDGGGWQSSYGGRGQTRQLMPGLAQTQFRR